MIRTERAKVKARNKSAYRLPSMGDHAGASNIDVSGIPWVAAADWRPNFSDARLWPGSPILSGSPQTWPELGEPGPQNFLIQWG